MINGYHTDRLDHCWLCFVLIHILGSFMLVILLGFRSGIILVNSLIWLYFAFAGREKRAGIFLCAVGWSVTLYALAHMPGSYQVSLILNMLLFVYVLYIYHGKTELLISESRIMPLRLTDIPYILVLTLLLFIIGEYVNAVSMLVFHNYVADSLGTLKENLWSGILVFAIVPAALEEIMFRGYVFERLGNNRKAVLISALLFALGHMNLNQMSYAFILGLLFATVFHITGNLSYTIVMHGFFNLFSLLLVAWEAHPVVNLILNVGLGGYSLFCPVLRNDSGHMQMSALLTGTGFCILAILLTMILLRHLGITYTADRWEGKEPGWKPGIIFYVAGMLCLILAVTHEAL